MWEIIWDNILATSALEFTAVAFLVAYVILAARQSPWCWPLSMVGVICYAIISFEAKLYAELPLQGFYLGISVYGWFHWKFGGKSRTALSVSNTVLNQWIKIGVFAIIATIIIGLGLDSWTDTDVPYLDSATTTLSLIGVWLQARKKIENWWLWIIADLIYVGLFYYKSYYFLSVLNIIYIIFAVYGYISWKKTVQNNDG